MNTTNNKDIIIDEIVQHIESQYAGVDWEVWQQICETLAKRSYQI